MSQEEITQRLANMVWEPPDVIAKWLTSLGLEITQQDDYALWARNPYLNVTAAIEVGGDPNTRAVSLAFVTAGMHWPQVYPGLQGLVNREWARRTKESKYDGVES